jgi:hypothetical protein
MGPRPKQISIETEDSFDPNDCSSRVFDVRAKFGRVKEERARQDGKLKDLLELQKKLDSSFRDQAGRLSASTPDAFGKAEDSERRLEILSRKRSLETARTNSLKDSTSTSVLSILSNESAGCKVIEAARKAMQEKKRQAEKALQKQKKSGPSAHLKRQKTGMAETADGKEAADSCSGSYRAPNGDVKKLSQSSSKVSRSAFSRIERGLPPPPLLL